MVSTQSAEDKLQALMIQKPLIIDIKPCYPNFSNETFEYNFANFDERGTDGISVCIASGEFNDIRKERDIKH